MKTKILFVDFDGVVSYSYFWYPLQESDPQLYENIQKFLFEENVHLVRDWMLGKFTSESINQLIAKKLNVSYEMLFDIFKTGCQNMKISEKVLDKLADLKKDYHLILATGNMDSFDRFTLPAEERLTEVFDEIHNSFNLGIFKTTNNGEYFKNVVSDKNNSFDNCFLVDDYPKICDMFSQLGGKAFCAKGEEEVLKCLDLL